MRIQIRSGGQTGAAFDAAIRLNLPYTGWVPKGRLDEEGRIPERYGNLIEAPDAIPETRTALNVRDANATLIVSHGPLHGGSAYTLLVANDLNKPCLHIDLDTTSPAAAAQTLRQWIRDHQVQTLNIAGPRASHDPAIYQAALHVLLQVLA